MNRINLLHSLLHFNQPLNEILSRLNAFDWDSDSALVTLEPQHIISILERYLAGELEPSQVENWANAIECREDIDYNPNSQELLPDIIYELANPILTSPLSKNTAVELMKQLSQTAASRK